MEFLLRLGVALVVIAAAYVLIAPRTPALRGWYAANACPNLDRLKQGLCEQTLSSGELTHALSLTGQSGAMAERLQKISERLDHLSSDFEQLRRKQDEQDNTVASVTRAQQEISQRTYELQQSLTVMQENVGKLRDAFASVSAPTISEPPNAGATASPATPPHAPPRRR
jgi:methyl-accepting chemotaxis protein